LQCGSVFDYSLLDKKSGFISVLFSGNNVKEIFKNESGGHRFQRSSPTDKKGRIHTSTITVAVLEPLEFNINNLDMSQIDIRDQRGSGPGGQHRNTTNSCIVATHIPTGISVKIDEKSQYQSKRLALAILSQKIEAIKKEELVNNRNANRKNQVGSGMRGDKVRTYREKDDNVVDHKTGKIWSLKNWMKGNW